MVLDYEYMDEPQRNSYVTLLSFVSFTVVPAGILKTSSMHSGP